MNPFGLTGIDQLGGRLKLRLLGHRFEFVDPAVCHQREEQVTVLNHEGTDATPLLHDLIVQRSRRALATR